MEILEGNGNDAGDVVSFFDFINNRSEEIVDAPFPRVFFIGDIIDSSRPNGQPVGWAFIEGMDSDNFENSSFVDGNGDGSRVGDRMTAAHEIGHLIFRNQYAQEMEMGRSNGHHENPRNLMARGSRMLYMNPDHISSDKRLDLEERDLLGESDLVELMGYNYEFYEK